MPLNVELLRTVDEKIQAEPEMFIMHRHCAYGEPGEPILDANRDFTEALKNGYRPACSERIFVVMPSCGWAACIGGWCNLLSQSPAPPELLNERALNLSKFYWPEVQKYAASLLGVSLFDGAELFHVHRWPEDIQRKFLNASTAKERASAAHEAIEDFIARLTK